MGVASIVACCIIGLVMSIFVIRELKHSKQHKYSTWQLVIVYIVSSVLIALATMGVRFVFGILFP